MIGVDVNFNYSIVKTIYSENLILLEVSNEENGNILEKSIILAPVVVVKGIVPVNLFEVKVINLAVIDVKKENEIVISRIGE